jgi:hypothetical protein
MLIGSKLMILGACAVLTVALAPPVVAHHAFPAEFDGNRPVLLKGKIVKVELVNPHAWIHIETTKPDGTTEVWMVEGGSPNTLLRKGITKATLPIGIEVVVDGYQAKDHTNRANGSDITLPDGRKLNLGSSHGTGAPGEAEPPSDSKK